MNKPIDRDAYYHRVKMTAEMSRAIEAEVLAFSGERWEIEFTDDFWFRLVDHTDEAHPAKTGWYISLEAAASKFQAIFPTLELKALTV